MHLGCAPSVLKSLFKGHILVRVQEEPTPLGPDALTGLQIW